MLIKKGYFSQLFPKTFIYLREFVTAKYPEFEGEIPDVQVRVVYNTPVYKILKHIFGRLDVANYHPYFNKIIIDISNFFESKDAENKIKQNPDLACKYLDQNQNTRSILVHEYQHFLQFRIRKYPFQTMIKLPENVGKREYKEKIIGIIRKELSSSPIFGYIFAGVKGATVMFIINQLFTKSLEKFAPKMAILTSKRMLYYLDPKEIEARLAEMVYNLVIDRDVHEAASYFIYSEKQLRDSIESLHLGIEEQQLLLTEKNKVNAEVIKRRIELMQRLLVEYERQLKMVPTLIEEAKKIAKKIKEERLLKSSE